MKRPPFPEIVVASTTALLACAAQVGPNYPGESLATFEGTVVTSHTAGPAPSMDAALIWDYGQDIPGHAYQRNVSARVHVDGTFPARFKLDVYAAPPAGGPALIVDRGGGATCTASGMFVARVAAVRAGTADGEIAESDVLGIDGNHFVAYLDRDAAPNDECVAYAARFLRIDATRGYHLVKVGGGGVGHGGEPVDNPQGLADPLTIVINASGQPSDAGAAMATFSDANAGRASASSATER